MRDEISKLKSTSKYPTSIVVNGINSLGVELAHSLIEQGGYVVLVDHQSEKAFEKLGELANSKLLTFVDFSAIAHLEDDLRRLDYIFYLGHQSTDLESEVSTQDFLEYSNYLNSVLNLGVKYEAKFLLTTSIRAHKIMMSGQEIDLNFDIDKRDKHTIYSEVEIQRYAESLVNEYSQKAKLNIRILRVGEVIGEGIDFNKNNTLDRLIFEAVRGENLQILGDGLEEEYYVHYLDGAYGILKAQFTPNTKNKIFSLSNQEAITTLSLAYKIQELEPRAGEIRFGKDKRSKGILRLYKPAPNLITIGWKAKVGFERALSQSIEQAYSYSSINSNDIGKNKKKADSSFSSKLKNFFFVAKNASDKDSEIEEENYGALSRLIAERKKHEMGRTGSIVIANDKLRSKVKKTRPESFFKKADRIIYNFFGKIKPDLGFLSKLSVWQFIFYLFIFTLGGLFYFFVFAPVLSLGKDIYFGNKNLSDTQQSFEEKNIGLAQESASKAANDFRSAEKTVENFGTFFDLIGQGDKYQSSLIAIKTAGSYSQGLSDSLNSILPIYEYFENFQDDVFYRPNSDSLLTAESRSDYTQYFEAIQLEQGELSDGINRMSSAIDLINKTDISFFPSQISTQIEEYIIGSQLVIDELERLETLGNYMPEILGYGESKTFLLLLHDNSRYNPAGGVVNSYALISFENGSLKIIQSNSISDLTLSFDKIDKKSLEQINLVAFTDVEEEEVTLEEFQLISDFRFFGSEIIPVFEKSLDTRIDGLISVNLDTLEALMGLQGGVTVDQINFDSSNLLSNVDLVLQDTGEESRRTEIISQLFALVLQNVFRSTGKDILELNSVLSNQLEQKDILLNIQNGGFQQVVKNNDWDGRTDKSSDFIRILGVSKIREFEQNRKPTLNVSVKVTLTNTLTTIKEVEIEPKNLQGLDYITICIPAGSVDLDFGDVNPLLYNQNFDSENECVSVKFNQIDKFTMSFKTFPFENTTGNSYNYSLSLQSNPGLDLVYDYEINFDSTLTPVEYNPSGLLQKDKLIYAGSLQGDLDLELKFEK
ncbi:MAG TPA: DUF4012 domain-containing protein [bacterium]|nr:DUF4012 domain-containing protein [bacterium]